MGFRPVEKALFLTTSERARFKDLAVRFRIWAGRQEYGTVQAILEHKFLQVLRKDSATMHREQLASHLRRDPPCFAASRLVSAGVEIR